MTATLDLDLPVTTLAGAPTTLREHAGKVLLIVNTASHCGLTPQYQGLQALYDRYKDRGLVVLGFPCNQFGAQEPGSAADITEFCQVNYGVTFPMYDKVDVNGPSAHPVFQFLRGALPGALGVEAIKWNFTKFLVDRDARPVHRYAPTTSPESLVADIESLL